MKKSPRFPKALALLPAGPLTSDALAQSIHDLFERMPLHFYAAAPIIESYRLIFPRRIINRAMIGAKQVLTPIAR